LPVIAHHFPLYTHDLLFLYYYSLFHFMGLQMKMMGNDGQHCSAHHFHDFFHENDGQQHQRRVTSREMCPQAGNCTKLRAKPPPQQFTEGCGSTLKPN